MPLPDLFAAFRWWLVLMMLGAAATPLAFTLLQRLPDKGYAFSKMLGLLLVSYLFWLLGSLGVVGNNLGGILLALGGLLAASLWAYRHAPRPGLLPWLRDNKRYILITEGVFLLIFALWTWVRAQNPAIVATEKPMEFAFLNAVGRSDTFPPLDPWLSGFAISYYYFGYVMTSVLARLAAVPEAIAFNLAIAWLTAGSALGAYGLVYNLIAAGRRAAGENVARLQRAAVGLGLVAAIALPLAGNLQIVLEALHGYGIGPAGFWAWVDVRDINTPPDPATPPRYEGSGWWWWRSSRVIHEYHLSGRAEEGLEPIAEFPGFSFVLGDMHPHVLALPFAFVSLAVALAWWRRSDGQEDDPPLSAGNTWQQVGFINRYRLLISEIGLPLLALTVVVLGGLSFLNTWDVLIHLFVVVGAFVLSQWQRTGRWDNRFLTQAAMVGLLLGVAAALLYLPFYIGFRSQAGPPFLLPMFMRPTRLTHYVIIFGMSLWSILILLGTLVAQQQRRRWRLALFSAAGLVGGLLLLMLFLGWVVAISAEGSDRVLSMATELGLALPPRLPDSPLLAQVGWGTQALLALIPAGLAARLQYPALTLLLATLAGLIVMVWAGLLQRDVAEETGERVPAGDSPTPTETTARRLPPAQTALPFVLLLIFTGVLLTLGPEFVYLRDNFGLRINTIFKFYYQTWVMFGVAALFALDYLWHRARTSGIVAAAGYALLLAGALLFPLYAVNSRAQEYAEPPTLNGMAQLSVYNPDEYDAIMWLRENVSGPAVILEAVGGQYSNFGRISAHTGLPTVLGWAGHEYQWRGSSTPEPGLRTPAVQQVYAEPDWEQTAEILDRYNVQFVYLGPLEIATYGSEGLDKLASRLAVAYANNSVTIYRWLPQ